MSPNRMVFAAMILFSSVVGCGRMVQTDPADAAALDKLAGYNLKSVINEHGRVSELVLEGSQVNDDALEVVKEFSELKRLSLYGSSVTDAGIRRLVGLKKLEALGVGKTKVTPEGLSDLTPCPKLTWVWVTKSQDLTEKAIAELRNSHSNWTIYDK